MQADLKTGKANEDVLLNITREFVDIMCSVNPEYTAAVIFEKGVKVLYLTILKAIYGCIRSALRWYKLFSQTLEKEVIIINPFDHCVAKTRINEKKCTIVWYVDNNKP